MWNPSKFKAAREAAKLTQKEAAVLLNTTNVSISRIENGEHDPRNSLIEAMSRVYSKPISFFLSDEAKAGVE